MQRTWRRAWQRGKSVYMSRQPADKPKSGGGTAVRIAKRLIPTSVAVGIMLASLGVGNANPTGGVVTTGAGTLTQIGGNMTINQTTDRLGINWQSFSIGAGERVQFNQPGASSVALNRVVGSDASAIYGTLTANGKVFLVNPNGILFAPGAQVNVGGLVASTLNISDDSFRSGNYVFEKNGMAGSVINQGTITGVDHAVLIGPQVRNEGTISARVSALAAGNKVSLDFNGDKLLNITVDTGAAGGSAVNTGAIMADGGLVIMSAGTKDALLSTVVNNSGMIKARSLANINGVIRLEGGAVTNSGTLDASGLSAGQTGGTVKVLGNNVALAAGSRIDVSGDIGGGTALIGGNFQGRGPEHNATNTTVASGAVINADAVTSGNGGQVAVWANDTTQFHGSISARGGNSGGDGGKVETSGLQSLKVTGSVNAGAARGKGGSWLLDPQDYTIDAAAAASIVTTLNTGTQVTVSNYTGSSGTNGDLTVANPLSWSSSANLQLSAVNNIYINAPITAPNGGLDILNVGGTIYVPAAIDIGTFILRNTLGEAKGVWRQVSGSLPAFTARNFSIANGPTFIRALGGDGTVGNPYRLADIYGVQGIGSYGMYNKAYILANPIDAGITATWNPSGSGWYYGFAPIGINIWPASYFSGIFDGGGFNISGLYVNNGPNSGGLFGYVNGATIRNLGLTGVNITGSANVGALAGYLSGGSVTNVKVTGAVSGNGGSFGVGGLIGESWNTTITNSQNAATVTSVSAKVGGLVGNNSSGSNITDSYSTGAVTGTTDGASVGGLVGSNDGATISNSYSTGSVSGYYAGGLAGRDRMGTITNSYHTTGTVSSPKYAGGLVGYAERTMISNSYNTGGVSVGGSYDGYAGGLVGYSVNTAGLGVRIEQSYNSGGVSITNNGNSFRVAGGLIGGSDTGYIFDSYNIGSVAMTGGSSGSGGGLVGFNLGGGQINYSYNTGAVSGFTNAGGLVGGTTNMGGYYSYWDKEASGQSTTRGEGTGLTTSQMKQQNSFLGFDFATKWRMYEGQSNPLIKALLKPLTVTVNNESKTYDKIAYSGSAGVTYSTGSAPAGVFGIGSLTYGGSAQGAINAGNYDITASGLYSIDQQGYDITYTSGMLTINKATLTVTAVANIKTYDGTTAAAVTPVITAGSLKGTDTAVLTAVYDNKNAGGGKTLTPTAVINDGNSGNNYAVTYVNNTSSIITKKDIAVTAVAAAKTYDGTTTSTVAPAASGLVSGDTISGTQVYDDKNAGSGKTLTVTGYTISDGNSGNNYNVTAVSTNTSGVITKKDITVSAVAAAKTYDGTTTSTVAPAASGLASGDTISGTQVYDDKNAGSGKTLTVTGYAISDGNSGNNYNVTAVNTNTNGVINQAALTVTAAANTKTYDGTTAAAVTPVITAGSLKGTDTAVLTAVYDNKNAGGGKTLTPTAAINDGNGGNNYAVTYVTNTSSIITKKDIAVTAVAAAKTYDGTTTSTVAPAASGLVSGDTISGTQVYDDKNAGSGKTLTVTGYTISDGNSGNNYNVTAVSTNTSGVITKKDITVSAVAAAKTYDGTTTSTMAPAASGLASGDTISGTQVYDDRNAGNGKTLTVTGYTISDGNSGNNYNVTAVSTNTSGVIIKKDITVSAVAATKTYDGTTTSTVAPAASGLASGDTISGTQVYDDRNAGNGKTLTVTGYTISDGNSGNNYNVTAVSTNTSGVINQAALTVTAATNTKTYDGTITAVTTPAITAGSLKGTDTAVLTAVYDNKNAGSGKTLTPTAAINDGNGGNNYAVTYVTNTSGVITKKDIAVTAVAATKTYDGTTTSAATPAASGLVSGDTISGTQVYDDKNAGSGKTLTVTGYTISDGNSGNNYNVTAVSTNASGVINQAALTVTAVVNTKTYDGTTTAATSPVITAGSLKGTDTAVLTAVYDNKNAGGGKTLTPTAGINDGNGGNNYAVTYVTNTGGVIEKAALTVTATGQNKTYDATTNAGVAYSDNRISGDSLTIGGTASFGDKNAGAGKAVSVSGISIGGADAGNYALQSTTAVTTADINKAHLTVTANDVSKQVGEPNPGFSTTYSGFAAGDSAASLGGSLTFTTPATTNSPVGSYVITPGGLSSGNYTISFVNGTLKITRQPDTYNGAVWSANHGNFGGASGRFGGFDSGFSGFNPGGGGYPLLQISGGINLGGVLSDSTGKGTTEKQ